MVPYQMMEAYFYTVRWQCLRDAKMIVKVSYQPAAMISAKLKRKIHRIQQNTELFEVNCFNYIRWLFKQQKEWKMPFLQFIYITCFIGFVIV